MRRLFMIELGRLQLLAVIAVSAVATTIVIANAHGQSGLTTQELTAFAHHGSDVVQSQPSAAVTSGGSASSPSSGAPLAGGSGSSLLSAGPAYKPPVTTTTTTAAPATTPPASGSSDTSSSNASSNSTSGSGTKKSTTPAAPKAKAKHVFVIALTTRSYAAAFGSHSVARYLNHTLKGKGTLLSGYHSLSGAELPDELAMVSGQPANPETRGNCVSYDDFGSHVKPSAAGIVTGKGCVYPNTVTTVADQVNGAGDDWGAFISGLGTKQTCIHPNSDAKDNSVLSFAGSQYDTRHNPFIYFHSLLDLGGCSANDVDLTKLPAALRSKAKTPEYTFIAPPLCDDSSAASCPDGKPGGLAGEDAFLKTWVPKILTSPAYKDKGVLMIVFAPSHSSAHESAATHSVGTSVWTNVVARVAAGAAAVDHAGAASAGPAKTTGSTSAPASSTPAGTTATTPTTTAPYEIVPPTTTPTTTGTTSTTTTPSHVTKPGQTTSPTVAIPAAGGARGILTGALIISSFTSRGRTVKSTYDPDSVLRVTEQLLGLTPLGQAAKASSFLSVAFPHL